MRIKMLVIPRDEIDGGVAGWLEQTSRNEPVIAATRDAAGDVDLICGACSSVLVQGFRLGAFTMDSSAFFVCSCGAANGAPPGVLQDEGAA